MTVPHAICAELESHGYICVERVSHARWKTLGRIKQVLILDGTATQTDPDYGPASRHRYLGVLEFDGVNAILDPVSSAGVIFDLNDPNSLPALVAKIESVAADESPAYEVYIACDEPGSNLIKAPYIMIHDQSNIIETLNEAADKLYPDV